MSSTVTAPIAREEYGGPHPWQTQAWAKVIRSLLRQREYFRWTDEYCKPLTIRGQEKLADLEGPAIFIPNHQSHMDTPVIMSGLTQQLQNNIYFGAAADRWFVKGKKKLILQPWYQSLGLGTFPIVRGGGSKTLDYARELLRKDCNICIFPEGTRAMGDELGKFRHGVSILAKEEGVPLVPVVLKGLRELRPKGARHIQPGPTSITFLDPITIPQEMEVPVATQMLWDRMNREFGQPLQFPTTRTDKPADKSVEKAA